MELTKKFTISDFNTKYPNDEACLHEIFTARYGSLKVCPACKKETNFYKIQTKKVYSCQYCGYQISPLSGTIFHKSSTSLRNWFFAIYLFSTSRNGVSAMELQRQLGVTYKCAHRIAKQIRELFVQNKEVLSNIVELDETYIGGRIKGSKMGRNLDHKTPVFGMVERKGQIKARVTVDTKRKTVMPIIKQHIQLGSEVMTDNYRPYDTLDKEGYTHQVIEHDLKQYAKGTVHINTLEGFWSQMKRSIDGTYHCVSPKYLQKYVNEFVYRYNHRNSVKPMFSLIFSEIVRLA